MPWKTFPRTHVGAIAADFFSVEVLTITGLVRYLVLFVIDLQTRRVQIGGVVRQPYGAWSIKSECFEQAGAAGCGPADIPAHLTPGAPKIARRPTGEAGRKP